MKRRETADPGAIRDPGLVVSNPRLTNIDRGSSDPGSSHSISVEARLLLRVVTSSSSSGKVTTSATPTPRCGQLDDRPRPGARPRTSTTRTSRP